MRMMWSPERLLEGLRSLDIRPREHPKLFTSTYENRQKRKRISQALCLLSPTHTPLALPHATMSSFTDILQVQISTAVKKVLADMDQSEQTDDFIQALFSELFPDGHAHEPSAAKSDAPESDSESTGSKKGRKKGPMSDEAKAAMVAKRKATMEAKATAPADAPKAEPKAKLSKEEAAKARSEAAKARYAALSEEEKAANKARLAAGKAAKKAVAAATA